MRKLIAAFISGGAIGAIVLAVALGLVFGSDSDVEKELATSAPEIPGASARAQTGSPGVQTSTVAADVPAPVAAAAPAAPADPTSHFAIDRNQSAIKIIAYQTGLLGESASVGTGSNVSGDIFLKQSGALGDSPSSFQLDMRTLRSNDIALSSFLKNDLEAGKFPTAEFVMETAEGIPANYTDGNEFTFRATGPLTMHGRTRQITWTVKARQSGDFLSMAADTDFNLTDFGWTPPDYGISRAKNTVHLQVTFVAVRAE